MALIYQHEYAEASVYGHAVAILREIGAGHGVHIDLGCGYGAIAEPIKASLGRDYIGFDLAEDGLLDLRARGFRAERIDLSRIDEAEQVIRSAVGDRPIASLSILDTLEHLTNGRDVLAMLRRLSGESGAPLVISVPNVNHKDIVLKSLIGRWDVTEAGLLDHTHVDFYNSGLLQKRAAATGWEQIGQKDWLLEISDQNFPARLPLLDVGSPLGGRLRELIECANPDFLVNQFVRAFRPVEPSGASLFPNRAGPQAIGLSVVAVIRSAEEAGAFAGISSLARQKAAGFEVIVIDARAPRAKGARRLRDALRELSGRNIKTLAVDATYDGQALLAGIAEASCSHVAFLPQETELSETWAARLEAAIMASPNSVAWVRCADRSTGRLSPFLDPDQPVSEFAVPCIAVRELGLMAKGAKPEATVQTLVTEAILVCGLNDAVGEEPTVIAARKLGAGDPVPDAVLSFLNTRPIVAPVGSAVEIEKAVQGARRAEGAFAELSKMHAELSGVRDLAQRTEHELSAELSEVRELAQRTEHEFAELQHATALVRELEQSRHSDGSFTSGASALAFVSLFPQVREFAKPYLDLLDRNLKTVDSDAARPFLSIVTRTQGTRLSTLCEMLLSLGGQSSTDFESIIVVHSDDPVLVSVVQGIVNEFPPSLSERVRVIQCSRPGRAAPLNDALAHARGRYIAFLDDDDFVFGHYVETYEQIAAASPGKMLRSVCVRQSFEYLNRGDWPRSRAQSWFELEWPANYDAVGHLGANYTPFMSVAFPRTIFVELGLRFDETLSTLEDWHLTTKAAALCGVESVAEVTSVYRWWSNANSSLFAHAASDWTENRLRVLSEGSTQPILLPTGARASINAAIERRDGLERETGVLREEARVLREETGALREDAGVLSERVHGEAETSAMRFALWDNRVRARLTEHLHSTSWRLTKPLRRLGGALTGRKPGLESDDAPGSTEEAWAKLQQIQASTSWQLSAPIRLAGRLVRVRPRSSASAIVGEAAVDAARLHLASTSWRLTRPLRVLSARMRGQASEGLSADEPIRSPEHALQILHEIRISSSWKVSAPIRLFGRWIGYGATSAAGGRLND